MNSYEYASTFEKLACKIVGHKFKGQALLSGTTKATRDGGMDAVLYVNGKFITVEAKLRQPKYTLGLKDIASSVLFYLLRLNDKHYIITNVYLAADTIKVLNNINSQNNCKLEYLEGEKIIAILKELVEDLTGKEKELAEYLIVNFKKRSRRQNLEEPALNTPTLLEPQRGLMNALFRSIQQKKCTILLGNTGTGKTTLARRIKSSTEAYYNKIYIDCNAYHTVEAFIFQLVNLQFGITVNDLIKEYVESSEQYVSTYQDEQTKERLQILTQILNSKYVDDINFIATHYLDSFLCSSSLMPTLLILDNYSKVSAKLDKFLVDYIYQSKTNIKFLTIIDIDQIGAHSLEILKTTGSFMGLNTCQTLKTVELNRKQVDEFFNSSCPRVQKEQREDLYRYFGGNLLLLSLACEEIKKHPNSNFEKIKPLSIESIYNNKLTEILSSKDIFYLQVFFISWLFNGCIPKRFIQLLQDVNAYNKILEIGFFEENDLEFSILNDTINKEISKLFIIQQIHHTAIDELLSSLQNEHLPDIATLRLNFYLNKSDFVSFAQNAIKAFENKSESVYITEAHVLIYIFLYTKNETEVEQISFLSNIFYDLIEDRIGVCGALLDLPILEEKLNNFFQTVELKSRNDIEKYKIAEANLKYVLYLYFSAKRKNNFNLAYDILCGCEKYLNLCKNDILYSKILRFRAICQKELGNKKEFFNLLRKYCKQHRKNPYLKATYYANLSAHIIAKNPFKSYKLLHKMAIPAAKCSKDKHLYLWLLNDKLICILLNRNCNQLEFLELYKQIIGNASRLCLETDLARAYNTYAAYLLKMERNENEARLYFQSAFYKLAYREPNNIMIHFAINYLQFIKAENTEERESLINLVIQWCNKNRDYIKDNLFSRCKKNLGRNKLYISLYTFFQILQKTKKTVAQELKNAIHFNELQTNKISFFLPFLFYRFVVNKQYIRLYLLFAIPHSFYQ